MNARSSSYNLGMTLSCLFVLACLALPVAAQEELPGPISEVIDVRLVNVEAVVTDRDGVRVPGLNAQDFRLLVDGEEVPIEFFTEIRGGDALAPRLVAGDVENIPAIAPGEPVETSYLVFIDEFFTLEHDRNRVLRSLTDELVHLGPGDRMAVVAWDGRRLDMLSSWSQSVPALRRVLQEAAERPSFGLRRMVEKRQRITPGLDRTRFLRASFLDGDLDPEERAYAHLLVDQLEGTIDAATSTLRSFGAPPGRKVMLALAGPWPFIPAEFVVEDQFRPVYDSAIPYGEELYEPLVETANLLGYTLYPVDVPGLQADNIADASRARLDSSTAGFVDFFQEAVLHQSLRYLASETGGRALLNGRRERPFSEVVADTRSFYWLGFTPQWAGDDERHQIEVEVKEPRLKLRTRSGFADFSKERQVTMAVESALLFGNPASAIPLHVEVGAARRSGRGKIEVPLTLTIPSDAVALLPVGDEYVAQLQLRVAALDSRGGRSEVSVLPIEVRTGEAPTPGGSFDYETTVRLRRRPHDVVVAIYDQTSGAMLSTLTEIGP